MPDEEVLVVTRQHWSIVAPALVAITVVGVAAVVGVLLVPRHVGGVDVGGARAVAATVIAVVAVVLVAARYLRWRFTRYVLTTRRILLERGVLSRDVESIALDRIQNTIIHRPLGDRIIGAGNIEIESAGRDGTEQLVRVPRSEQFYARLLQAMGGTGRPPAL
jgi:uncharacterized membrane protein YdbT with pleckstrin-like domain